MLLCVYNSDRQILLCQPGTPLSTRPLTRDVPGICDLTRECLQHLLLPLAVCCQQHPQHAAWAEGEEVVQVEPRVWRATAVVVQPLLLANRAEHVLESCHCLIRAL